MSNEEKMAINERYKYLRRMKKRYQDASRSQRGQLLDEMEFATQLHRKSLVRLMNGPLQRTPRRKQRQRSYGPDVDDALRVIAESMDYICAERLTPNLPWLAQHLAQHGELQLSPSLLAALERISVSTVQRIMARVRQDERRLPRRGPRPANSVTRDVPMRRIPWQEQQPGRFETDLVHHCGVSASGEYVCTVQMIDVATGWSERRAVLGRSYLVMRDAFLCFCARLPFPVLEIHPDNGSEFFNHHMLRFWRDRLGPITISRSRPYQKNDNRFVEQKNATLVRAYIGHDRLDTVAQTQALNRIYDLMWLYYNLFQPVMRLTEKKLLREDGELVYVRRRHDQARTPFDRLCATSAIAPLHQQQLHSLRRSINPRQLRQEIHSLIAQLFTLPGASAEQRENVHHTLTFDAYDEQNWYYVAPQQSTLLVHPQYTGKEQDTFGNIII